MLEALLEPFCVGRDSVHGIGSCITYRLPITRIVSNSFPWNAYGSYYINGLRITIQSPRITCHHVISRELFLVFFALWISTKILAGLSCVSLGILHHSFGQNTKIDFAIITSNDFQGII